MHPQYTDLLSRIPEPPIWFDEHAVPRYCQFNPHVITDVYATACTLLLIACQDCGQEFKVASSSNVMSTYQISNAIKERWIGWGDPPNVSCCPAGPTMNSETLKVLEFWRYDDNHDWQRVPELEIEVERE